MPARTARTRSSSSTVAKSPVDLIALSRDLLLALSFTKNSSSNYALAVNMSEGAAWYSCGEIGEKPIHFVGFARTRQDAERARAILDYVTSWKSTQVFAGGKFIGKQDAFSRVLDCYLQASGCTDRTAHCYSIVDDPALSRDLFGGTLAIEFIRPSYTKAVEIDRYQFPCTLVLHRFHFQRDHPASIRDQIQAAAVKLGCEWCPFFDPDGFKKVGSRMESEDAFD